MVPERSVPEVAVPATALLSLRRSLRSEAGPLAAVHALHAAGYDSGAALAGAFLEGIDGGSPNVAADAFWTRLSEFWSRRGWGSLTHRSPHPAVGLLSSSDWAEAGEEGRETQPSCAFTAGMLSAVLGRAAGGRIAVLETTCRSRGDDACVFAYGSEEAIHRLYGILLEGADLESGLEEL